ncbi:MAG: PorV/PorQ family protein [bacterium]
MMAGLRKYLRWHLGIVAVLCFSLAGSAVGAKYAGESFTLGAGARALALGGAYTALADDATSIYYNPAGLSRPAARQCLLLHSETFGSLVNHDFVAVSLPTRMSGRPGGLGLGIYRVGGGGIKLTEWDADLGRPVVIEEVGHYDYLVLAGGGMELSQKLRLGAAARIIVRSLGNESGYGLGIDLGLQYQPWQPFGLGLTVHNASSSFISYDNGAQESILPAVRVGAGYLLRLAQFTLRSTAETELLFEGRRYAAQVWLNDISADFRYGAELGYHEVIFFRAGSDIGKLAIGVGLRFDRFALDGAFLDHPDLDNSYRLSLGINF